MPFDSTTFRTHASRYGDQAFRVVRIVRAQPSWVSQIAAGVGVLVLLAVVLLLVIPFLVVTALAFIALMGLAAAKRRLARMRAPNGPLDGRRNVRVIVRND